jgi:AbiV family abortive infection protein
MTKKEEEIIRQIAKRGKEVEETITQKNALNRFKRYSGELSAFLSSGFQVVAGPTQEEMAQQLLQIIKHAEGLWNDATLLFSRKKYATACFLSIVCIEECAKINFGRFQTQFSFVYPKTSAANLPRKSALTSHEMKHFLAACAGALVNARMDRVLGIKRVNSFISDCEKGKLEKLRQSCLYADINQSRSTVLLPNEQITKEQALFYTCLAGELLAEVAGIHYSIWERLLHKVDKFEEKHGISTSKNNTKAV